MLDLTVRTVCRRALMILFGPIFILVFVVALGALVGILDTVRCLAIEFYREVWLPMWRKA